MNTSNPRSAPTRAGLALGVILTLVSSFLAPLAASAAGLGDAAPAAASAVGEAVQGDLASQGIVPAADLRQFRPGNIISNEVFFNSSAMSESEVSAFLHQRVPRCQAGYTCLPDYGQATDTRAADAYCSAYAGAAWESSARIIWKVAQACGINPQVLIVTLQKEQGLVTHTAPSELRYRIAMGQGCPDTSACDQRYYGFFNQVLGAARQFRIYGISPNFRWYAPGRTWNVRFHPDVACGTSPVYIENQATANLYYYTPYQPNPSAITAGYGTGDRCGSYGNRNFYNYFTDWFGSTQISNLTLAKTASSPDVFLVSGSSRWRIGDGESYGELNAAFGPTHVVGDAALTAFTLRGTTGSVLHDAGSGVMAIVAGGAFHRIPSCEHAVLWGASCASPTTVSSTLLSRLPTGDEVGLYFRVRGSDTWGRFDTATRAATMYNSAAAAAANGTVRNPPYAPHISAERYASLTKTQTYFAPAQLVKSTSDARVYLTAEFDQLLWVPSWADIAEYNRGPGDLAVVPPADLARYRESGTVEPTIACGGATYFAAGGWLHRLADPAKVGLGAVNVGTATCAQFSVAVAKGQAALAIKTEASSDVAVVEGGKRRGVLTWDLLVGRNGGTVPVIATVKPATVEALPLGSSIADGLVIKSSSSPDLQLISDSTAHWIPSVGLASDLGVSLAHRGLADADAAQYARGAALGLWVSCGGQIAFGSGGKLRSVTPEAAAGFPVVALGPAACARFTTDEAAPRERVFVKYVGAPEVYVTEKGKLRHVTSWDALVRLGEGSAPQILPLSADGFVTLPLGAPIA